LIRCSGSGCLLNLGLNLPPPLGGNAIKTCLVNN
jgi:hypothetical protein